MLRFEVRKLAVDLVVKCRKADGRDYREVGFRPDEIPSEGASGAGGGFGDARFVLSSIGVDGERIIGFDDRRCPIRDVSILAEIERLG